ncbi:MMPL family transporter [Nocardia huaxiensis]|uniref:MMPL family transporter n=1 Tax=Nocardia huaxiensis TaxID=2755382 RepID=UPI001E43C843|nr:MMPL family transporter [Nocardia huaxiensis]UFS98673.1 MMPL family transporter [Nocardia huaxiensis]
MGVLARLAVGRPKTVVAVILALLVLAGVGGASVQQRLSGGGFWNADAESARAARILAEKYTTGTPNVIVLVDVPQTSGTVDTPAVSAAGTALTKELAAVEGVRSVNSYWSTGSLEFLRNGDRSRALIAVDIPGDEIAVEKVAERLLADYRDRDYEGLHLRLGGAAVSYHDVTEQLTHDMKVSEAVSIPILLVLLVLIFGSLVAAGLPLVLGIVSIVGTFGTLRLLTEFTQVSSYALNLTTVLGLGLGIDYSLFLVSRFREERRAGREIPAAVLTTVTTAGRTVLFSAATIVIAMLAMLLFPMPFLRSLAAACLSVTLLAALATVTLLPALLMLFGHRIDALDLRRGVRTLLGRPEPTPKQPEQGFWYRTARRVTARPLAFGGAALLLVLLLGAPFAGLKLGLTDDRALPATVESRQVGDVLRAEFPATTAGQFDVVVDGPISGADLMTLTTRLQQLEHVRLVRSVPGADGAHLTVLPDIDPYSPAADTLLEQIRATDSPAPLLVGGATAENTDTKAGLAQRLPLVVALIVIAMIILLFAFTGSVIIPIKAVLLNTLSLSATFGAMVYIFQNGHLKWLVGDFTETGYLAAPVPVLVFCLAFGLSMDYEVFLLSRIAEEYRVRGVTDDAVAYGLERTGRIVTAAASLMAIVCVGLAFSQVSFTKLMGVGLTLAVLMDATVIRGVLVPALMRLLGDANWWAPGFLKRVHHRIAVREESTATV